VTLLQHRGAANPDYPITIGSGIRLAVAVHSGCTNWAVQPGCTNASLSALFPSKTNADIGGYIGGSLSRARAEYTTSMAGVYAPRILGEQTTNVNSDFLCVRRVRSQYCLVGYQATQSRCATADSGATITAVRKQPAGFRRRKLSAVVRKAITSYYTDQEQIEIARAAKHQNISMSSFVASAALKEARRLVR